MPEKDHSKQLAKGGEMKIAIDARTFKKKNAGGISLYIQKLVRYQLEKTKNSLVLFCCKNVIWRDFAINGSFGERVKVINLKTQNARASEENKIIDNEIIPKLIQNEKVNLYHACANWGTSSREVPVPQILTIHDIIPYSVRESSFLDDKIYATFKELTASSIKNSSLIITISRFSQKEIIKRFSVAKNKIVVVLNGSDFERSGVGIENEKEYLEKNELNRGQYFVYVGGFYKRKNINRVVQAFKIFSNMHPNFKLVVTGANDSNDYEKKQFKIFEKEVKGCEKIISYLGYVSNEEKNSLVKNSAALIYPSYYEGFGLPILEAMHLGVAVLCAKASSLPEVGGDIPFYFDPFSIDDIATAMEKLVCNQKLASKKIIQGKKRALQYSWNKTFRKVNKIYQELVKKV